MALGVGAFSSAIFHLTTHAFFKCTSFFENAGAFLTKHNEQNIQKMGGLMCKNTSNIAFFHRSLVSGGAAFGFWFF